MDYCARRSTLEENYRLLNSESPSHSETLVRGRLVVKSQFGDDRRNEWAARRQVRSEGGARVSYTTNTRKKPNADPQTNHHNPCSRHCSSWPQRECHSSP